MAAAPRSQHTVVDWRERGAAVVAAAPGEVAYDLEIDLPAEMFDQLDPNGAPMGARQLANNGIALVEDEDDQEHDVEDAHEQVDPEMEQDLAPILEEEANVEEAVVEVAAAPRSQHTVVDWREQEVAEGVSEADLPPPPPLPPLGLGLPGMYGHTSNLAPRSSSRSGRGVRRPRHYEEVADEAQLHANITDPDDTEHDWDPDMKANSEDELAIFGYLMTQYSLKAGMRKFADRAEEAATAELTQLHVMDTWMPEDPTKLSRVDKIRALSSLMFFKEKRDGKLKGRQCVDGSPQRGYISKEEAASPAVTTESVFTTAAISAWEGRYNRTFDIPSAFVNTDTDENVLMVLKDDLAEMMVKIAPNIYRKYVTTNSKGVPMLYVRLRKSLYGLLRSALLFYRKLRRELEADGFVVNPYDPCVANKTTRSGHQITVVWHVDDLMVSCKDDFAITELACYLGKIYGPKMTMHTGNRHDYLGVFYEFKDRKVEVSMFDYLDKIFDDFPEDIRGGAPVATPAANHLFEIRPESEAKYLPEEQGVAFHHTVAQVLFLTPRARRDVAVVTAFLTSRVKRPDEDDWGKLKRLLRYLWWTRRLKLTLEVTSLGITKWFVDASHLAHWDCKGHGGAAMFLGKGAITSYSNKLKSNTRSSTETEIVAVDRYMPQMLWSLYFIRAQGWDVKHIELHQDNISAQLLEINGQFSSSSKTKHIKAKVFFVKDKVDEGDVVIKDCPTEVMWADVNTKPKQGRVYKEMRAVLMNCPVDYIDETDPRRNQGPIVKKRGSVPKASGVAVPKASGVVKKAKAIKLAAPKRNAKGGLVSDDKAVASVKRVRWHRTTRQTQECVGRGSPESRQAQSRAQRDFWLSLKYRPSRGARRPSRGARGIADRRWRVLR